MLSDVLVTYICYKSLSKQILFHKWLTYKIMQSMRKCSGYFRFVNSGFMNKCG